MTSDRDNEVLTNPKLPRGWRLIDGATGRVDAAEADALPAYRSWWFELEQQWLKSQ